MAHTPELEQVSGSRVVISMGMGIHEVDAEDLENGKFTMVRTINPDITKDEQIFEKRVWK